MPLYPQYSAATTATVNDKAFDWLKRQRGNPLFAQCPNITNTQTIFRRWDSVNEHIDSWIGRQNTYWRVFMVFHRNTLIKAILSLFLREKWTAAERSIGLYGRAIHANVSVTLRAKGMVEAYTDVTVEALAKQGVKRLAIVAPGFSVDCLETLEEIAIGLEETFLEHGGEKFTYIPCLNATEGSNRLIASLVENELQGWI